MKFKFSALVIAADTGLWLRPVPYERIARAAGNALINFTYDGNGNILTAKRNGNNGPMDDLNYHYNYDGNNNLINNRLNYITDAATGYDYGTDLKTQGYNNYLYDAIGNLTNDVGAGSSNISWTVYGKLKSVTGSNGTTTYSYDPAGHRVSKTANEVSTWYVRDAQGNPLAIYDNAGGAVNWKEQTLYGSSRLGTWLPNVSNINDASSFEAVNVAWETWGNRRYELNNHLGNVMATITDRRIQVADGSPQGFHFEPDVSSAQEYYAFGASLPGRSGSMVYNPVTSASTWQSGADGYRYGFNGKENDNDVKGVGNQQDYGMRIYDPRVERFLSVDPITAKYPELTPYQFASNTPIQAIDLDGLEGVKSIETDANGNTKIIITKNIVILTQAQKAIPANAPADKVEKIQKQNQKIDKNNAQAVSDKKAELNEFYNGNGGAKNSAGDNVEFRFNVSGINDFDKKGLKQNIIDQKYSQIGKDNGILATKNGLGLVAPASVLTNESSGGAQGKTTGPSTMRLNGNAPEGALSHEVLHTFGLDDNGYDKGGLLNSPPSTYLAGRGRPSY